MAIEKRRSGHRSGKFGTSAKLEGSGGALLHRGAHITHGLKNLANYGKCIICHLEPLDGLPLEGGYCDREACLAEKNRGEAEIVAQRTVEIGRQTGFIKPADPVGAEVQKPGVSRIFERDGGKRIVKSDSWHKEQLRLQEERERANAELVHSGKVQEPEEVATELSEKEPKIFTPQNESKFAGSFIKKLRIPTEQEKKDGSAEGGSERARLFNKPRFR